MFQLFIYYLPACLVFTKTERLLKLVWGYTWGVGLVIHTRPSDQVKGEQWETCGGGDETLVCEVLQPSIYDSGSACLLPSWVERRATRCQVALSQSMWRQWWDPGSRWAGSPQPAESRTVEKESDSHKLIQHFNESSRQSVPENHCALCFPGHRHFFSPRFTLSCPFQPLNLFSGRRDKLSTESTFQIFDSLLLYSHVMFCSVSELVLH